MKSVAKLLALSTAVPSYRYSQQEVMERMEHIFSGPKELLERLKPIYANSGIKTRYSCVPLEWYENPVSWQKKNRLYLENALNLLEKVTLDCLQSANKNIQDIDGIVVASSSGIATPSLDALLMERLKMRRDVQRLPIFGLGCAAGVIGLSRAASLARDNPKKLVLFLVVELCGLTFRQRDPSKANLVATALFGDGAAAALLSCEGNGPKITASGEHTWPQSLDIMGWQVMDDGLQVLFSQDIPTLVERDFPRVANHFLDQHGLTKSNINAWVFHPGGAKILQAFATALNLDQGALQHSRSILEDYGNMSAATVLFVLKRTLEAGVGGRYLLTALGPGFTAGFTLMEGA